MSDMRYGSDDELRVAIAEQVMGWERDGQAVDITLTRWRCPDGAYRTYAEIPLYPVRMTEAWAVVEHLRERWTQYTDRYGHLPRQTWPAPPFDDQLFFERLRRHADRRWPWAFLYATPRAICEAALEAVRAAGDTEQT